MYMEVIMEVVDLRFQIVYLIRMDDYIKMLHAKFQPSITMFKTISSLYKIWCHKVNFDFISYGCRKRPLALCAPFYHYPLLIAVLKFKSKPKSIKFCENGEIECFLA